MAIMLNPCPFCGGEAEVERLGDARQSAIVSCGDCGARLESNEHGAGGSWNARTASVVEEEVKALRRKAIRREIWNKVDEAREKWIGSSRMFVVAAVALAFVHFAPQWIGVTPTLAVACLAASTGGNAIFHLVCYHLVNREARRGNG